MTAESRVDSIKRKAEEIALNLIRNDLSSDDPDLAQICSRLSVFRSVLNGSGSTLDEGAAREFIQAGFGMVDFVPGALLPEEQEALRLLDALSIKLSKMSSSLLGFLL